jgi:hypothetical protein
LYDLFSVEREFPMHGENDPIIAHGGYRGLKSFQLSEIVFDATVKFCEQFVERLSRTTDQMVWPPGTGGRTLPRVPRYPAAS